MKCPGQHSCCCISLHLLIVAVLAAAVWLVYSFNMLPRLHDINPLLTCLPALCCVLLLLCSVWLRRW